MEKSQELEQKAAILQKLRGINQEMESLSEMPGYQEVLNMTDEKLGIVPDLKLDLTDMKFGIWEAKNILLEEVNTLGRRAASATNVNFCNFDLNPIL